ncbi:hypothetical protein [Streptomyces sp. NPDC006270]|uniref:hypothetical protein n=1 Tax=Streptomyces sp. NPDC006270 TaxID=3364741 RepID=UPI0036D09FBC
MSAQSSTTGQWWIVAVATSALFLAAVHFVFGNGKATLSSLVAPAAGGITVLGAGRDHSEVEALIMFSASLIFLVLLILALKPEIPKIGRRPWRVRRTSSRSGRPASTGFRR